MSDSDTKRPVTLTVLCFLATVAVGAAMLNALLHDPVRSPQLLPWHLLTYSVVLTAFAGIWHMRRWGVYLYAAAVVINLGMAVIVNLGVAAGRAPIKWQSVAIPAAILCVLLCYYRSMKN